METEALGQMRPKSRSRCSSSGMMSSPWRVFGLSSKSDHNDESSLGRMSTNRSSMVYRWIYNAALAA
eukprot:scaffold356064_cov71-Attheya_sp.AAC.2